MRTLASAVLTICVSASALTAQRVVIKNATPADVVLAVNKELSGQGFRLEDSTTSEARFGLDRGLVSQRSGGIVKNVPVVLELHLRFRQKPEGLEVNAYEEVVGARGQGSVEFRTSVRSRPERDGMQQLLELVKADLEARPSAP